MRITCLVACFVSRSGEDFTLGGSTKFSDLEDGGCKFEQDGQRNSRNPKCFDPLHLQLHQT